MAPRRISGRGWGIKVTAIPRVQQNEQTRGQTPIGKCCAWGLTPYVRWGAGAVIGGVFLWASWHKLVEPEVFATAIFRYQLVPYVMINALAIVLPWLEVLAGVCVIAVPRYRRAAALVLLGLLVVYTAAVVINLVRGMDTDCGCFSSAAADPIRWRHVWRNAGFMLLALMAFREPRQRPACVEEGGR